MMESGHQNGRCFHMMHCKCSIVPRTFIAKLSGSKPLAPNRSFDKATLQDGLEVLRTDCILVT